jgi:uncharacterized membrane protein
MTHSDYRTARPLARGLGWFSLGLGVAQVAAPGAVDRLIGVDDGPVNQALMRAVGVREIAAGAGILSSSRPVGWLWSRVAGDAMDLASLGVAYVSDNDRRRVAAALASVAGITVLDLIASVRTTRAPRPVLEKPPMEAKGAITVKRPIDEVYLYWHDFANLPNFMHHLDSVQVSGAKRSHWKANAPAGRFVEWDAVILDETPNVLIAWASVDGADVENTGTVRFAPAPGGRGTEVRVDLHYAQPGGAVGATVAKLFGEDPRQQINDDLRRFKQVMETGEVVRSEGSPQGTSTRQLLRQRPAQPLP